MAEENKKRDFFIDVAFVITIATCLSIVFYRFVFKLLYANCPKSAIFLLVVFGLLIVAGMYLYHYYYFKSKLIEANNEYFTNCKNCVVNKVDNESYLAYYNLVPFKELLRIENSLEKDDEVIVYTSHLDTEDDAEQIVKDNIKKGVIYNVLYYEGTKEKENKLKNTGYKNVLPLEKNENSFDYQLTNKNTGSETGFDLMFYKKQNKDAEAYFCVNFSKGVCNKSKVSNCNNKCLKSLKEDEREKHLFYKKIDNELASSLFVTLSNIIKEKKQ